MKKYVKPLGILGTFIILIIIILSASTQHLSTLDATAVVFTKPNTGSNFIVNEQIEFSVTLYLIATDVSSPVCSGYRVIAQNQDADRDDVIISVSNLELTRIVIVTETISLDIVGRWRLIAYFTVESLTDGTVDELYNNVYIEIVDGVVTPIETETITETTTVVQTETETTVETVTETEIITETEVQTETTTETETETITETTTEIVDSPLVKEETTESESTIPGFSVIVMTIIPAIIIWRKHNEIK